MIFYILASIQMFSSTYTQFVNLDPMRLLFLIAYYELPHIRILYHVFSTLFKSLIALIFCFGCHLLVGHLLFFANFSPLFCLVWLFVALYYAFSTSLSSFYRFFLFCFSIFALFYPFMNILYNS